MLAACRGHSPESFAATCTGGSGSKQPTPGRLPSVPAAREGAPRAGGFSASDCRRGTPGKGSHGCYCLPASGARDGPLLRNRRPGGTDTSGRTGGTCSRVEGDKRTEMPGLGRWLVLAAPIERQDGGTVTGSACGPLAGRIARSVRSGRIPALISRPKVAKIACRAQVFDAWCNQRPFLPSPFKTCTTAMIVFQFRVVAGASNSLSIWRR